MIINVENDEMLGRTNDKALHITLIEQQKEIERLNKENKLLQDMDKILRNENVDLKLRISKAIEYINGLWLDDKGKILKIKERLYFILKGDADE